MNIERWKPIENFPNYLISNAGKVKNQKTERILKSCNDSHGYPQVILSNNGYKQAHRIHRLVAKAFVGGQDDSLEVNHRNGIKNESNMTNLEWVTHRENTKHAYNTGLAHRSSRAGSPPTKVLVVETGQVFDSESECAKSLGINREGINACVNGRSKSYHKLHFERVI